MLSLVVVVTERVLNGCHRKLPPTVVSRAALDWWLELRLLWRGIWS